MKAIYSGIPVLLFPLLLFAQTDDALEIDSLLKLNDSLLFDVGFNTCDIAQFQQLVSDDFEFYHDEAGITASKEDFIAGIREGLCTLPYKPRRELVEGSLQVYPLRKNGLVYGALQTGEHRFSALREDGSEHVTSTALFTHLWLLEKGTWKLSRGISYNHQVPGAPEG